MNLCSTRDPIHTHTVIYRFRAIASPPRGHRRQAQRSCPPRERPPEGILDIFFARCFFCFFLYFGCEGFSGFNYPLVGSPYIFANFFLLLHDGEFDLIRRAHLLCILKRHHTYGINTFVCSYSLNPKPSHSFLLSSLLDWQPYLLCGFPGFRGSSRETRSRSRAA